MDEFQKNSLPCFLIFSLIIHAISAATDTMDSSHTIRDGETLISSGGIFELGFFSPGNSTNRYLGIWYKNIQVSTYVWVANRQFPLTTKSGLLKFTQPGNLALLNNTNGTIIWSSNSSRPVLNPSARLLDSGNLVVKDANDNDNRPENFVWQSFDNPSDSFLPGMSFGWNFKTGVETYFASWRSNEDPAPGEFAIHLDPVGYPQIVLKRAEMIRSRIGPWNGIRFSGAAGTRNDPTLRINKNEVKYREDSAVQPVVDWLTVSPTGAVLRSTWDYQNRAWIVYSSLPADDCDRYNICGVYGICNIGNSPYCGCLDRFVPRDSESKGCKRKRAFNCRDDVFLKYSGIKLPDSRNSSFNDGRMRVAECEAECTRNCSCVAFTQLDVREEASGCLFYYGDLVDIRSMDQHGQDLYIRMASSELENIAHSKGKNRVTLIAIFTSVAGIVLLCLGLILICSQKRKREKGLFSGSHGKEAELPFFNLSTISKATHHFAINNKLGEGGFGSVYRGMLEDGQEIAVKRLSKTSLQGIDELKNEVILIAKLQHRNLVRLLGCCIQGDENLLIYEYMPNNSLDLILFDQTKSMLLDWQKRFHIIIGIAKGLLYLHQDSRLRIIHRDLKASNILLDVDMNPKISDFGLARCFGGNETEAKTCRVVGTYGYMSPEYAINGLFSVKSDVFSFGVLVLEVVSGKRNRGFSHKDHTLNLLGHAWTLYKEDKSGELVDATLGDSFDISQALRSIHVGLLCAQKCPEDRPSMSSVVFMLGNEVELPQAKQPGFFTETQSFSTGTNAANSVYSENKLTCTLPQGR